MKFKNKLIITLILIFNNLFSAEGVLDTNFNKNGSQPGTVTTKIFIFSQINSIFLDNENNVVAGGYAFKNDYNFALARYKKNGVLDETFNADQNNGPKKGVVVTKVGISSLITSIAKFGNKIIAVGTSRENANSLEQITLARYNQDGSLDQNFNKNGNLGPKKGIITLNLWLTSHAGAVVVDSEQNIFVVGSVWNPSFGHEMAVLKFKRNGRLDTTFNQNGTIPGVFSKTITNVSRGLAVAIDEQNRIIIAGYSELGLTAIRCNPNGTLDNTFAPASAGVFSIMIGNDNNNLPKFTDIVVDSEQRIYLVGSTTKGFTLIRLKNNGTLDETFNPNGAQPGVAITKINNSAQSYAVALDGNEKIIVNGFSEANGISFFTIARYLKKGKLDKKNFNPNGTRPGTNSTLVGSFASSYASITNDSKSKITIAGSSNNQFSLARYII